MRLYNVEPRAWRSDDVAVGLGLGQVHCLLLLQDEEAVELGGGLFPVVVPAKLEQADGLGSGLRHDTLRNTGTIRQEVLQNSVSSFSFKI